VSNGQSEQLSATPLSINEVKVKHLRCHNELSWSCEPGLNLLLGANGCGKTSLLEAVYLMAHGRSFRQARDPFLVKRNEERFFIHGNWKRFGPMNLSVAGRRGQTSVRLQGRDVQRRKDVSESFPVLVEAPQGSKIVDGVSGERRRWLDGLVMTCYQGKATHYRSYLRAVMQRSRLLRKRASAEELDVWEHQIVLHGMPVVQTRMSLIEEINKLLASETALTESAITLEMSMPEYNESGWLERLRDKRDGDLKSGGLRFGPHCDALKILFQGRDIRSSGSRGQQKLAAIAIKMAECGLWSRYRRLIPVLLLDDCLEALDQKRQQTVLRRLEKSPAQILMTAPNGVNIVSDIKIRIQMLGEQGLSDAGEATDLEYEPRVVMEEAA